MFLITEQLLQLHQAPAVIFQVLLILGVHRVDLSFSGRLREERADEELRKSIQSAGEMLQNR